MSPTTDEIIFLIYSGLNSTYTSLLLASELEAPAIRWCRDQLKAANGNRSTSADAVDQDCTITEVFIQSYKPPRTRTGYTIVRKPIAMVGGTDRLPESGKRVHVVCHEETLEAVYVSDDLGDAEANAEGRMGVVVRSVEMRKGGSIIPATVFVLRWWLCGWD